MLKKIAREQYRFGTFTIWRRPGSGSAGRPWVVYRSDDIVHDFPTLKDCIGYLSILGI
jgi:hypothetical protein